LDNSHVLFVFRQKLLRVEVRKRWTDGDLPTFRRMDTSNVEELEVFCERLSKLTSFLSLGKELIRKKVINIIRERRKYVNKVIDLHDIFIRTIS